MANNGDATGEPMTLFRSASNRDVKHVRSLLSWPAKRRASDFATAKAEWEALLKLSAGGETWVANAEAGWRRPGLGSMAANCPTISAITGMVEGCRAGCSRLAAAIEEWTAPGALRLVLGQTGRHNRPMMRPARTSQRGRSRRTRCSRSGCGLVASN